MKPIVKNIAILILLPLTLSAQDDHKGLTISPQLGIFGALDADPQIFLAWGDKIDAVRYNEIFTVKFLCLTEQAYILLRPL